MRGLPFEGRGVDSPQKRAGQCYFTVVCKASSLSNEDSGDAKASVHAVWPWDVESRSAREELSLQWLAREDMIRCKERFRLWLTEMTHNAKSTGVEDSFTHLPSSDDLLS